MAGFLSKLTTGLVRTRDNLTARIQAALAGARLDDSVLEEMEEALIAADVGVAASGKIIDMLRQRVREGRLSSTTEVVRELKGIVEEILRDKAGSINLPGGLAVVMVVGVNGVGKTTTIAKLARSFKLQGRKVMLAAADTFRAAAIDQLAIWANGIGVDIVRHQEGSDAAAVAYDAVKAASARGLDTVIVDTAGRLHTKVNLMEELKKVARVLGREVTGAPHEVLLVLDATTGQNALQQAKVFKEAVGVTGIVLTKLDGTARGGIVIAIANELGIPIKMVGVGEGMDDLRPFVPSEFAEALFASRHS